MLSGTNFHTFNDQVYTDFKKLVESLTEGQLSGEDTKKLFKHQRFLYEYMAAHNKTPEDVLNSRGLLLYHRLGSGKTISAIAIAEACRTYQVDKDDMADYKTEEEYKRKVIVMLPANLRHDPWYKELSEFCYKDCDLMNNLDEVDDLKSKKADKVLKEYDYHFVNYNAYSNNAWVRQKNEIPTRKSMPGKYSNLMTSDDNPFDDSVLIIDEVHNLLNTINNEYKTSKAGGFFKELYKQLMMAKNMKVIALSGTPVMNHPVELSFLFNILRGFVPGRPDIMFETDEVEFDKLFFNKVSDEISLKNREMFLRRINGLVSYYQGYRDDMFAKVVEDEVALPLSGEQAEKYLTARNIEYIKLMSSSRFARKRTDDVDKEVKVMQSDLSIKCSNIVFPSYLWHKKELARMNLRRNGKPIDISKTLEKYEFNDDGKIVKYDGLVNPKKHSPEEAKKIIFNLLDNDKKPLNVHNELPMISNKMYHITKRILQSNGPVIVYSQFEGVYGVSMLAEVLKQNGMIDIQDKITKKGGSFDLKTTKDIVKANKNQPGFVMWTGNNRNVKLKDVFNKSANKDGSLIKVFLITAAGKEGISLRNIRQVHIMEPWWNDVITRQVIGRGVRITSHNDLKPEDFLDLRVDKAQRTNGVKLVNVFKYYSYVDFRQDLFLDKSFEKKNAYEQAKLLFDAQTKMKKSSINHITKEIAKEKLTKSDLILGLMQQNAVDCKLNFNNNDYDCFEQDRIIEYFSTWNMDDNELSKMENFALKLTVIEEDGKTFWKDVNNKVYEKKQGESIGITMGNFSKYYRKVGHYDNKIQRIIFDETYVNIPKPAKKENNFFEAIVQDSVSGKTVLEFSNYEKSLYFSKLSPKKLISVNMLSVTDRMEEIKKVVSDNVDLEAYDVSSSTDMFNLLTYIKGISHVYVDCASIDDMSMINALFLAISQNKIKHFILGNVASTNINLDMVISHFDNNVMTYNDDVYIDLISSQGMKNLTNIVYTIITNLNEDMLTSDVLERVYMTIQALMDEGIIVEDMLKDMCEKNLLTDILPALRDEEIEGFMGLFQIEKISDEIDLYPEEDIEIVSVISEIKQRMGIEHPLYDEMDYSLASMFIQNEITTVEELREVYISTYNRRLENLPVSQDVINSMLIYIEPRLLRVKDIRATYEHEILDVPRKYDLRKLELVDELNNAYGLY